MDKHRSYGGLQKKMHHWAGIVKVESDCIVILNSLKSSKGHNLYNNGKLMLSNPLATKRLHGETQESLD
jgi:hypothetical protein